MINRELSWLEFNHRVLEEAISKENPLLERLKFLSIVSSNLDEFFEIRVAGLKQQKQSGVEEKGADGATAEEQLVAILDRVRRLVDGQYALWNDCLQEELEAEGIRFLSFGELDEDQLAYLANYYEKSVYPVLTPLAIDPGHPFPQLLNKSLNVVVELHGTDLTTDLAVVQVPRILPRVVPLPNEKSDRHDFVFIGNLIQQYVDSLFHGVEVVGVHQFRVTRNSNLYFDEEEADNLLSAIELELRKMNRGNAVRLEVQADCPDYLNQRLLSIFNLEEDDLFVVNGPINFVRLLPVIGEIPRPDLKYKAYVAPVGVVKQEGQSIFDVIREGDRLLHHPFESFHPVVDLIREAAEDPAVLAIKQTLYRTSGDSPIVHALVEASQNGKQVSVIVELKARFDEAANIKWAKMLQEAGVNVVYGIVGLKTHCKALLIVRDEPGGIRRYVHIGTGNYHPSTAKLYTDLGLFTAREDIAIDVAELFNLLTGVSRFPGMRKLLVAPFNLHEQMMKLIQREQKSAQRGMPAGIFAKMNSLVDEEIIEALYAASQAGVEVQLMVRGICCLRPGVPGLSENIEVRSIVGRFLEHSRIFRFDNGGDPELYIGSADWMPRNFFRRVEAAVPIEDPVLKSQVFDLLRMYWKDNQKARVLQPSGEYKMVGKEEAEEAAFNVQEELLAQAQKLRIAQTPPL